MSAVMNETPHAIPFWKRWAVSLRYALRIPYALNMETIQTVSRPKETYIFIHGIGNTLHSWDEVCTHMPENVRLIGVDLLGFGLSPKPHRALYDARFQARSVLRTLLRTPFTRRPILVGHSLGALVAIEMARRYPLLFKGVVLCSPPLYKPIDDSHLGRFSRDKLLRRLYALIRQHPGQLEKLSPIAIKMGFANKSLTVRGDSVGAYVASLESSIINQTSLRDVQTLKIPVHILYGAFDPLVVGAHIQALQDTRNGITVQKIPAGHEVVGRFARSVARTLKEL